jgi:acyl carrier protein
MVDPRIVNILTECLDVPSSQIVPEAHIINDLGADSLDTVEIVMRLEDEFDMQLTDEETEEIFTVKDIVNYIDSF